MKMMMVIEEEEAYAKSVALGQPHYNTTTMSLNKNLPVIHIIYIPFLYLYLSSLLFFNLMIEMCGSLGLEFPLWNWME